MTRAGQRPLLAQIVLLDYDRWDAVPSLLIRYRLVPSVIDGPVYIGHIDRLLDPVARDEDRYAIEIFLTHVDRPISGSFTFPIGGLLL